MSRGQPTLVQEVVHVASREGSKHRDDVAISGHESSHSVPSMQVECTASCGRFVLEETGTRDEVSGRVESLDTLPG